MLAHGIFYSHILISLIVIPLGIMIHRKLYYNIKNEEHLEKGKVIQRIIKTYSIVQCTVTPSLLVLMTPLLDASVVNELNFTVKYYLIQFVTFGGICLILYIGLNSLVIAVCRYMFIVFHKWTDEIGISRCRSAIISTSVGLPIILTILQTWVMSTEEIFSSSPFSVEFSSDSRNNSFILCHQTIFSTFDNPFYCLVTDWVPETVVFIIKITTLASGALVSSNVIEAFIYIHTFTFCIRYHSKKKLFLLLLLIQKNTGDYYVIL